MINVSGILVSLYHTAHSNMWQSCYNLMRLQCIIMVAAIRKRCCLVAGVQCGTLAQQVYIPVSHWSVSTATTSANFVCGKSKPHCFYGNGITRKSGQILGKNKSNATAQVYVLRRFYSAALALIDLPVSMYQFADRGHYAISMYIHHTRDSGTVNHVIL